MTTNPTRCPLLALFVQTPPCLRPSLLDPDSVSCALLVTIPLEAALGHTSSVEWTGVQSVALRLGVIVFAQFQI